MNTPNTPDIQNMTPLEIAELKKFLAAGSSILSEIKTLRDSLSDLKSTFVKESGFTKRFIGRLLTVYYKGTLTTELSEVYSLQEILDTVDHPGQST